MWILRDLLTFSFSEVSSDHQSIGDGQRRKKVFCPGCQHGLKAQQRVDVLNWSRDAAKQEGEQVRLNLWTRPSKTCQPERRFEGRGELLMSLHVLEVKPGEAC